MYTYPNLVICDRRGRAMELHNWEAPPDPHTRLYLLSPGTVRRSIHTFLSALPDVSIAVEDGRTRQLLSLNDLRIRDRLLNSLEDQAQTGEPDELLIEDTHRELLLRWFGEYGVQVYGGAAPSVDTMLQGGARAERLKVVKPAAT